MTRVLKFGLAAMLSLGTALPETPQIVFENQFVKVVEDRIAPGAVEASHAQGRGVMVCVTASKTVVTTVDGKTTKRQHAAGTAYWVEAVTGSVRNTGKAESRTFRIEVKGSEVPPATGEPLDPLDLSPVTQKLIFENQYVRVIDDHIAVGFTEPMHRHPHGVVVYLSEPYLSEQILPDGRTTKNSRKFAEASWAEPIKHSVKNISTVASHAVRIELKY